MTKSSSSMRADRTVSERGLRDALIRPSLLGTAGFLPVFLVAAVGPLLHRELGLTGFDLGLLIASFFVAFAIGSVPSGHATERWGPARSGRIAATGLVLSMMVVALAGDQFEILWVGLVIGGLANSLAQPSANATIAGVAPADRQGLVFGAKQSAGMAASVLAGLSVPLIAVEHGWRSAFSAGALVGLATLFLPLAPPVRGHEARSHSVAEDRAMLKVLVVGAGFAWAATTAMGSFLTTAGVEAGMTASGAGVVLTVCSAAAIVTRVLAGWLADHQAQRSLTGAGLLVIAGAVGVLMLASLEQSLFVAGALVAFGIGWGWPGLLYFSVIRLDLASPAVTTGYLSAGAATGSAAGPLVFGAISDHVSFRVAWLSTATLFVAGGGVFWLVDQRRRARHA